MKAGLNRTDLCNISKTLYISTLVGASLNLPHEGGALVTIMSSVVENQLTAARCCAVPAYSCVQVGGQTACKHIRSC